MWVLGRVLGLKKEACLTMSLGALCSVKVILAVYAGWLPPLYSWAAAPFLVAAWIHFRRHADLKSTLILAVAAIFFAHGGQLQIAYYAALMLGGLALLHLLRVTRSGGGRLAARTLAGLVAALGLTALGVAYLYLPNLLEAPLLSRAAGGEAWSRSGHALGVRDLATLIHPEILGSPLDGRQPEIWDSAAYINLPLLFLALIPLAVAGHRKKAQPWVLGFLACLLLALDTPLHTLFSRVVPGYGLFRSPSRFVILAAFFALPAAGIGIEALKEWLGKKTDARRARIWVVGLLVLLVLEGAFYAHRYGGVLSHEEVVPELEYAKLLNDKTGPFRVAPIPRFTLNYGWAAFAGVELITGYDPYNYRHTRALVRMITDNQVGEGPAVWVDLGALQRWDILDAFNVRYVVSVSPLKSHQSRLKPLGVFADQPHFHFYRGVERKNVFLFENPSAKARVFSVSQVESVADERAATAWVQSNDLGDHAVVMEGPGSPELGGMAGKVSPSSAAMVGVIRTPPDALTATLQCPDRCFVVISETWHPGWTARLNGEDIPLWQTDVAFMGTWIPSGKHELDLAFRPPGWSLGLGISGLAFALLGLLTLVARRRPSFQGPPSG
jgi:hypothetical protein